MERDAKADDSSASAGLGGLRDIDELDGTGKKQGATNDDDDDDNYDDDEEF